MSIIIFLIILSALVIVHELGHMSVAKFFGIRVDEFGLGYPPRIKKLFRWKETDFTLNWLPFGGFVKIFGENPDVDQSKSEQIMPDNFQSKNRGIQALVLFAGVFFNFIFAWFMISLGFMFGLPSPDVYGVSAQDSKTVITRVLPDTPAFNAGVKPGDIVTNISRGGKTLSQETNSNNLLPEEVSNFISKDNSSLVLSINRSGENIDFKIIPEAGIRAEKPAIGVSMDKIGMVRLPPHLAIYHSLGVAWGLTLSTAEALQTFIYEIFTGNADFSSVTGPVGLVDMTGDVAQLGFGYLLSFTALISINLSLINLLPFPALDGGRLLIVFGEAIFQRKTPAKLVNNLNAAGFIVLVLLMIIITIRDIGNIL